MGFQGEIIHKKELIEATVCTQLKDAPQNYNRFRDIKKTFVEKMLRLISEKIW